MKLVEPLSEFVIPCKEYYDVTRKLADILVKYFILTYGKKL